MADSDQQERWARMWKHCRLPDGENTKTLDDFKAAGNKTLEQALSAARQLLAGEGVIFLTLISDSNRGKSHLAKAVCLAKIKQGVPSRYGFVPDFLGELKDGFDQEGEDSFRYRLASLMDVPLLVLDDLGTENMTPWGIETIQRIINHRYELKLPLVVTTNRPLDEICGRRNDSERLASMRIESRLKREPWCRVILLDGAPPYDWRNDKSHARSRNFEELSAGATLRLRK